MSILNDELKVRIHQLYDTQLHNARRLDLSLETTAVSFEILYTTLSLNIIILLNVQRDSRYSQGLIDMMQRLDNLTREGRPTGELSRKVDEALRQETRAFFNRVSASNAKKWGQSLQRWEHDTGSILYEAKDKGLHYPDSKALSKNKSKVTALDLAMEENRLEEDYNRNWLRHEGFHLQEAFQSQQRKLDKEWDMYTKQLSDAVLVKKKAILGSNYAGYMEKNKAYEISEEDSHDHRFHHPEKQKSLIHTAPVFSPKLEGVSRTSRVAAGSAIQAVRNGKVDSAVQAEVRAIK